MTTFLNAMVYIFAGFGFLVAAATASVTVMDWRWQRSPAAKAWRQKVRDQYPPRGGAGGRGED